MIINGVSESVSFSKTVKLIPKLSDLKSFQRDKPSKAIVCSRFRLCNFIFEFSSLARNGICFRVCFFLFLLQLKGNEQLQPKRKVKYTHRLKKKTSKRRRKTAKKLNGICKQGNQLKEKRMLIKEKRSKNTK